MIDFKAMAHEVFLRSPDDDSGVIRAALHRVAVTVLLEAAEAADDEFADKDAWVGQWLRDRADRVKRGAT